jgi:hypothetical protein
MCPMLLEIVMLGIAWEQVIAQDVVMELANLLKINAIVREIVIVADRLFAQKRRRFVRRVLVFQGMLLIIVSLIHALRKMLGAGIFIGLTILIRVVGKRNFAGRICIMGCRLLRQKGSVSRKEKEIEKESR